VDDEVVGRVWNFRDVTARTRAEDALRKTTEQLIQAQRIAKIGNWHVTFGMDEASDVWTVSKELADIWGRTGTTSVTTQAGFARMHPDDEESTRRCWESAKRGVGATRWEHRIIVDDAIKWIQVSANVVFDDDGNAVEASGTNQDITEQKNAEEQLRRSDALFRAMAETLPVAIYVSTGTDQSGQYLNPTFTKMFGYTLDDLPSVARWWPLAYPDPAYRQRVAGEWQRKVEAAIATQSGIEPMETQVTCRDGSIRIIYWNFIASGDRNFAFGFDLTERKRAEQQLRVAATAFNAQEGMVVTDEQGTILKVNQAFTKITGYEEGEVLGKNPRILKSGRQSEEFYLRLWQTIATHGSWEGEIWNRRKDGEIYPEYMVITAVKDEQGRVTNYVGTFNDITLIKSAAREIENLAFYDPLTRLPNRRLLLDRLDKALAVMKRSGTRGALLFLDLDHFKNLNDTMGHDVGDLLLQQVAERLTRNVREGDTVSRLGGDEFVVMLEHLSDRQVDAAAQAENIAQKILAALSKPYRLRDHDYSSSSSIGITLIGSDKWGMEELLKQADIAMYQSKKSGRNTISFFDAEMQRSITTRVALESDLRAALENDQFTLHFQVQVDLNGKAVGAEALIRWIHPHRGEMMPAEFIPLAEEAGLILPLGNWVVNAACRQLQGWQQNASTRDLVLSINVSARQFHQAEFVSQVRDAVQQRHIDPARLKLELTESMLLTDFDDTVAKMNELRRDGIQFSLDDFGTGFSSLQYLKQLPIGELKIDQTFVRDIAIDGNDRVIIQTIIAMAKLLELDVIAEGVENEEQRAILAEVGCEKFQGYLTGKPASISEFEARLQVPGLARASA
jgi:diguanylate cyclase (GGDEF)-like protein/PAS domain S-box-containing protein